jgi:hypothetical protein
MAEAEQHAFLLLMARGASPSVACQQLGISLPRLAASLEEDDLFCRRLERVKELLSQNVAAALYRCAMEGSVAAQTFYLKNRPPPEWPNAAQSLPHGLEELNDDELIAQFREEAPALLARLAETDPQAPGPQKS